MNKLLLKLVLAFSGIYKRMGADITQLKAILQVKLTMDDRKPLMMSGRKKKATRFGSALVAFISFASGLVYILPLVLFKDQVLGWTGYFSFFTLFLSMMLITDLVSVLIDVKDRYILFPKPVGDKTILLSRLLHILIYFTRIVLPMALPGFITACIMYGWKAVLYYPVGLVLMMMMILFLVLGIYLTLLKIVSAKKFQAVIGNFQIVFSIFIFGFYYLVPQLMQKNDLLELTLADFSWLKFFPTYWIATIWSWLADAPVLPGTKWFGILAIVLPVFCLWLTIKFLAPSFVQRLSEASGSDHTPAEKKVMKQRVGNKEPFYLVLSKLLNKTSVAQAGFNFTWLQTQRSRLFKMRVYPSFAYVPIYFLYFMLNSRNSFSDSWAHLGSSGRHIGLLYMSGFVMLQCVNYITYSDQYKAAWVFHMARAPYAGSVMSGAFKAAYLKYFVPFFVFMSGFVLFMWGWRVIGDILLALVNVSFITLLFNMVSYRYLPFSRIEQIKGMSGRTLVGFAALLVAGALGVGHYFARNVPWLVALFVVLSIILFWMAWDSYAKTPWVKIKSDE